MHNLLLFELVNTENASIIVVTGEWNQVLARASIVNFAKFANADRRGGNVTLSDLVG